MSKRFCKLGLMAGTAMFFASGAMAQDCRGAQANGPECTLSSETYLNTILGQGFRMDHNPSLITMEEGGEGHTFHGSAGPDFDPNCYYIYKNGEIHCGLTVVAWQFSDTNPGDGGLCLIPGSHKGNYACPQEIRKWEAHRDIVRQVSCKAGDVVIFTEAVTHGTLPWTAEHQRRSALFRMSPGNLAYVSGYNPWPEAVLADIDAQGITEIICLGDIVGYGPDPCACLELVMQRCDYNPLATIQVRLQVLMSEFAEARSMACQQVQPDLHT